MAKKFSEVLRELLEAHPHLEDTPLGELAPDLPDSWGAARTVGSLRTSPLILPRTERRRAERAIAKKLTALLGGDLRVVGTPKDLDAIGLSWLADVPVADFARWKAGHGLEEWQFPYHLRWSEKPLRQSKLRVGIVRALQAHVRRDYLRVLPALRPPADPRLHPLFDAYHAQLAEGLRTTAALNVDMDLSLYEEPLRIVSSPGPCRDPDDEPAEVHLDLDDATVRCTCARDRSDPCPVALGVILMFLQNISRTSAVSDQIATVLEMPRWKRVMRHLPEVEADDRDLGWEVDLEKQKIRAIRVRPFKRKPGLRRWSLDEKQISLYAVDPRDHVVETLRHPGFLDVAVRALRGHPRVLVPDEAEPVRIEVAPVELALQAGDGGLELALRERGRVLSLSSPEVSWDPVERALFVRELPPELHTLLERWDRSVIPLGPGDPADVLVALTERGLTVVVDEGLLRETRPADPRPVVRLRGAGAGLEVSLRVRPWPGQPLRPPGEGSPQLHLSDGDGVVTVQVQAAEEQRRALTLVREAELPSPDPTWQWELSDPADALQLIEWLRARPELQVEWDGRPRYALSSDAGSLSLQVSDATRWFTVGGQLDVQGASVPLAALLGAIRDRQRYVRLDEDRWVRLEDHLRQRLDVAARTLAEQGDELVLTSAHAPLLADLAADVAAAVPPRWEELQGRMVAAATLDPPVPDGLSATLRDYQRDGFRWLVRLAGWAPGAVLADDMGLGKTVQALALLLHRAHMGPALVVAPTSVGFGWLAEAERFASSLVVRPYRGPGRAAFLPALAPGDVLVTSYDILTRDAELLQGVEWGTLVLDEAQAVKNPGAQRTRAARGLRSRFAVALTGTPVENHLSDLWSLMAIVVPGLLGSQRGFRQRFAVPAEVHGEAAARESLARVVRPFVLRRTKAEVAPELPPRTEVSLKVALSPAEHELYERLRASTLDALLAGGAAWEGRHLEVLTALTYLRQLACHPALVYPDSRVASSKLRALGHLLDEVREQGHRALVFSQFVRLLRLAAEHLRARGFTVLMLDGSTPARQRKHLVEAFQAGEADVFLISIKAGGTGLNLTAATYVFHLDPWWNPAVEDQASDRAHRIGQDQPVTVYRLVAGGTIEESILQLHADKRDLAEAVLAGADAASLSTQELVGLLREGTVGPSSTPGSSSTPSSPVVLDATWSEEQGPAGRLAGPAPEPAPPESLPALEPAAPEPAPPEPAGPAKLDLRQLLAGFDAHLGARVDAGDMRRQTRGLYRRPLERMVAWAEARELQLSDVAELSGYLDELAAGTWEGPRSDASVGRTALNQLLRWLG